MRKLVILVKKELSRKFSPVSSLFKGLGEHVLGENYIEKSSSDCFHQGFKKLAPVGK